MGKYLEVKSIQKRLHLDSKKSNTALDRKQRQAAKNTKGNAVESRTEEERARYWLGRCLDFPMAMQILHADSNAGHRRGATAE
jgi:hypothetical protein